MKKKDIERIVRALITERIDDGESVERSKIVPEIIAMHCRIDGPGKEFGMCLIYDGIYSIAKSVIEKITKPDNCDDSQLLFDGYDNTRKAYSFPTENGDCVIIPTQFCTDEQLLGRAAEFRNQSAGLLAHTNDIEKYVMNRRKR